MRSLRAVTTVSALVAISCSRASSKEAIEPASATQTGAEACQPTVARLPAGTTTNSLPGAYRLTLVATSGRAAGQVVTGDLRVDGSRGGAPVDSLAGTAAIALSTVGAVSPTRMNSDRGESYRVTALRWMSNTGGVQSPEITIRFGELVAPGTTRPIEGSYMALYLGSLSSGGFTGTWSSGTGDPTLPAAGGRFCAIRG